MTISHRAEEFEPEYEPPIGGIDTKMTVDEKLDAILEFLEELRPLMDMAKTFTSGSKVDKVRAMIRNGR